MTRQFRIIARTTLVLMALSSMVWAAPSSARASGATQIGGIGYLAEPGVCTDPVGNGADFTLRLTGDLQGCYYVFVETAVCSPSGTYRESGNEIFIGQYNGGSGSFRTTYKFSGKYQDCPNLLNEIFGRCQHPLTAGSGVGVFAGVTGRLDFKDDIEAANFPYRGHLRFATRGSQSTIHQDSTTVVVMLTSPSAACSASVGHRLDARDATLTSQGRRPPMARPSRPGARAGGGSPAHSGGRQAALSLERLQTR